MLFYAMRPDDATNKYPVFTRYGNLTKNLRTATNKAQLCSGRVYSTDGHNVELLADFGVIAQVESISKPEPVLTKREYWAARNQAAIFA